MLSLKTKRASRPSLHEEKDVRVKSAKLDNAARLPDRSEHNMQLLSPGLLELATALQRPIYVELEH